MKGLNRATPLLAVFVLLVVTGCAGREMTTTEKTALGGALVGAGTGAIIGSTTGRAGAGTAIGAGVGALGGALLGQAIESEAAKQRQLAEQERYRQQQLGTYGGGTYGTQPPLNQQQEAQAIEREREKQRQLEQEIADLKQKLAQQQSQGGTVTQTSPPPTSTELSTRVASLTPQEKQARLEEVKRKVSDLREELELAKRIDNIALQKELEKQIKDLEDERAELERQLAWTR